MKKLFILGVLFTLFAVSASAQVTSGPIQHQRTEQGIRTEGRHEERDGKMSPRERRRIHHMRHHKHRHGSHRRHNGHRRVM